jgi:hypothetical protein
MSVSGCHTVSRASPMSRASLIATALGAALLATFATAPARAQAVGNAPWCVDMGDMGMGVMECQYYTWRQCMARAFGLTNVCKSNPWYVPERPPVRRQRRDPRQ